MFFVTFVQNNISKVMNFQELQQKQKDFFSTNTTKDITFRKEMLKKIKTVLEQNTEKMYEAIADDFGKSAFETYTTEISFIIKEIDFFLKNLTALAKPKKVRTNLANQFGSSKIYSEPLGNILVIGAWNYPYQLSLLPAICAIAAGNTVILKPSEIAAKTASVMQEIINENFNQEFFYVLLGGVDETTEILKLNFDKIFFTGSPKVGQIVYEAAAKHLTPVTLELGGKSPAIITNSANLEVAARRIIWGKFLNAGQTCIAPDYILIDEKVKNSFLSLCKTQIEKSQYTLHSESYTKIINQRNFERLKKLIMPEKIFFGGKTDEETRYIEPTILDNVTWDDAVMQEEIFGPILPILSFKNFSDAVAMVKSHPKPLSAYLFSNEAKEKEIFTQEISFGGGCINDTLMHISNPNLPFGGVGNSGIGSYHGKFSFETFSHQKGVLDRTAWGEPTIKYPPYTEANKNLMKKFL